MAPIPRAEEEARLQKLQQIVEVAERISIPRITQLLEMTPEYVWKRVVDWAKKFNFTISGEDLIFNKATVSSLISELDKEFKKWGKDGKV